MHVIGIVGGIASGKSTVSGMFRELGAHLLDADNAGHLVLEQPDVIEQLQNRWGIDVVLPNGQIDRAAVAARVFGPVPNAPVELEFLESVTHPKIRDHLRKEIAIAQQEDAPAVVLDAPLLFEGGWDEICDIVVFVDALLDDRKRRVVERGWSGDELESRESAQLRLEEKKQRSDFVVHNNGSIDETREQIHRLWRQLLKGAPAEQH